MSEPTYETDIEATITAERFENSHGDDEIEVHIEGPTGYANYDFPVHLDVLRRFGPLQRVYYSHGTIVASYRYGSVHGNLSRGGISLQDDEHDPPVETVVWTREDGFNDDSDSIVDEAYADPVPCDDESCDCNTEDDSDSIVDEAFSEMDNDGHE